MTQIAVYTPQALAELLFQSRVDRAGSARLLVGIAGAPGSGKSTLAEILVAQLNGLLSTRNESAIVVPMDGFHLDNAILAQHGTRAVKGSPQTFDIVGLLNLVKRLCGSTGETVYAPVFDRESDLARNAALAVHQHHSIVLVEGNYLLLQRDGWRKLGVLFDCTIMLDVAEAVLEKRLVQRWLDHGHTAEGALEKATGNDIPNAHVVLSESADAHVKYGSVRQ